MTADTGIDAGTCTVGDCGRPRTKTGAGTCSMHARLRGRIAAEPWLALTARILRGTPPRPGALCVWRAPLFDATTNEDIAAAVRICRRCPELEGLPPMGRFPLTRAGAARRHRGTTPEGGTLRLESSHVTPTVWVAPGRIRPIRLRLSTGLRVAMTADEAVELATQLADAVEELKADERRANNPVPQFTNTIHQ